jgi:GAF domain-containing protein
VEGRSLREQPAEAARALRDVVQNRRAEMAAVFAMMTALTSTLDLRRLLGYVARLCAELTGCAGVLVYLWDEDRERLVVRAAVEGYERWIDRFSLALGEGLTGWTALTRRPGFIRDDPTADPRFKSVPELNDERFQSYLTIPIVAPDQRLIGVITMHTEAPHEFGQDDLAIMETISALIGATIENAELYERQERQVRVLHTLAEASQAIVQTSSLRHMLHRLASAAGPLAGADRCAVLTLDEEGTHLAVEATWSAGREPAGGAPTAFAAEGAWARLLGATAPIVLTRREHRDAFAAFGVLAPRAKTAVVAPMRVADRVVGTFLCSSDAARPFGREDRELLAMVASQAALAVQNARLIEALTQKNVVRDLFEALALGEDDELGVEAQAGRLGVDLSRPHVLAVFEASTDASGFDGERMWFALKQDLAAELPGSLLADRDRTLTALLRLADPAGLDRLVQRLTELKASHERPPELVISVGVSRVCGRVEDYPDAFEQARRALLVGRAVRGPGAAVTFDELGAQWHLFGVAQQQVRDVYQERLERLLEHDREKGSQLFRTVEAYLECMGNAKLTAERLFVHRNTLRQRFEKIRRVAGVDLSDLGHWFDLMMAVRIIRLREVAR